VIFKRLLATEEKAHGPNHPDVARLLHLLGALYYTQGQYVQAETLYNRSLAIQEKTLGPDDPAVATILDSMSALYRKTGRETEAEAIEKRGAPIWLAPRHPHKVRVKPISLEETTVGRDEPCPCGSGKKYEKCCGMNK
jgi:uncharacterized protein YecA (UPF0149 family)